MGKRITKQVHKALVAQLARKWFVVGPNAVHQELVLVMAIDAFTTQGFSEPMIRKIIGDATGLVGKELDTAITEASSVR